MVKIKRNKMSELICYIENGQIRNKTALRYAFDNLSDGRYKLTIVKSSKRSLQQNNWLHAVLPDILKGLREVGYNELRDVNDAKNFVKSLFFKKIITNGIEEHEMIEDTGKTSKEVFMERADRIITWGREYLNIDIAPPFKQIEIF